MRRRILTGVTVLSTLAGCGGASSGNATPSPIEATTTPVTTEQLTTSPPAGPPEATPQVCVNSIYEAQIAVRTTEKVIDTQEQKAAAFDAANSTALTAAQSEQTAHLTKLAPVLKDWIPLAAECLLNTTATVDCITANAVLGNINPLVADAIEGNSLNAALTQVKKLHEQFWGYAADCLSTSD
jgi:hypothetical protein